MTFEQLSNIITENNIPHDVKLQSDSGWECCETDIDGVYYDRQNNRLIFTQSGNVNEEWFDKQGIKTLYGVHKKCSTCIYLDGKKCMVKEKKLTYKDDSTYCNGFKEK